MILLIIFISLSAVGWVWFYFAVRRAPLDTDLWGPLASLWDCHPEERLDIIMRVPKLKSIVRERGLHAAFPDCNPETLRQMVATHQGLREFLSDRREEADNYIYYEE